MTVQAGETRIIGIGNLFRRDDGAGLAVARLIAKQHPNVTVIEHSGDGLALIEAWHGTTRVVLVDAVQSGCASGAVQHFDALGTPLPIGCFNGSTHGFNVAEAIELARALNRLPVHLELFGIEGRDFTTGEGLSPEVESAENIRRPSGRQNREEYPVEHP